MNYSFLNQIVLLCQKKSFIEQNNQLIRNFISNQRFHIQKILQIYFLEKNKPVLIKMLLNAKGLLIFILFLEFCISSQLTLSNSINISEKKQVSYLIHSDIQHQCECMNSGKCETAEDQEFTIAEHSSFCICPSQFIGSKCEIQAIKLTQNTEIFQIISVKEYKYFYYEPHEQNMFTFQFHLCFNSKNSRRKFDDRDLQKSATFFITTQNMFGEFQTNENKLNSSTVTLQYNECKLISVDYTVLSQKRSNTIQKLILGVKLGQRNIVSFTKSSENGQKFTSIDQKKNADYLLKRSSAQQLVQNYNSQPKFEIQQYYFQGTNLTYIKRQSKWKVGDPHKKPENFKKFRMLYLKFSAYPFMVQTFVKNVIYSFVTLGTFILMAAIIFIVRSKILGYRLNSSLSVNGRMINDLKHFQVYLSRKKYEKQWDINRSHSNNTSQFQCAICLLNFEEGQYFRKTPCNHTFHQTCVDSWCQQILTCPICRMSLTQQYIKEYLSSTLNTLNQLNQVNQIKN